METLPEILNEDMINAALGYWDRGYQPIPLLLGTKQAMFPWKELQTRRLRREEVENLFSGNLCNLGLITGEVTNTVMVDVDDPAILNEVLERIGDTPMKSQTPRGNFHLWFRRRAGVHYGNGVDIKGLHVDLRCEGAYGVEAWSRSKEGVPYRWLGEILPADHLPLMKVKWLREREPQRRVQAVEVTIDVQRTLRRARAYLATVEGAISGQRGHNVAYRAACVLCHKFGLTPEQAFEVFWEWNLATCEPIFSEKECWHKLNDAWKNRPK